MNSVVDARKYKAWQEERRRVRQLRDKLGRPVDKEIADTVVILRLLGFNTTGSCAGHIKRLTDGPYVIFESPQARHWATIARKAVDTEKEIYRKMRKKANYYRALDFKRLSLYLEEFYSRKPLNYDTHLVVQSLPMTLNILRCHGAEMMIAAKGYKNKRDLLTNNQKEMKAFTSYLQDKYFYDI